MTEGLYDLFSAVYIFCLDVQISSFVSPLYSMPVQDPPARPLCLAHGQVAFSNTPSSGASYTACCEQCPKKDTSLAASRFE